MCDAVPGESQYDLVTILPQEFYHNLLFAGSIVAEVKNVKREIVQTAQLYKGYRTRFDSFLATVGGCAILGYPDASSLVNLQMPTTNHLLAEAVCINDLYWIPAK